MDSVECIVVGAGVIGLAAARALALAGREVVVLEAAEAIGTEISSRNSEVIHAGIYYPADSLMARFCVAGRRALYTYADAHQVPYRRCGKLIVATNAEELGRLDSIRARAMRNGVDDLETLTAAQAERLEPALSCTGALLSPSTGIIDSHAFMLALEGDAESHGAMIAFLSPLVGAEVTGDGFIVSVGGAEPTKIACRILVNAAGLSAPAVARAIVGVPPDTVPTAYYAKGSYFALAARCPFDRLIYPVPVPGGLGVHLTVDLGGQARFGPDVEWVEQINYAIDARRGAGFYDAIRRYWPGLPDGALMPGYAGIRPKIAPPTTPTLDFQVLGADVHGVRGLVNLFGIESPGLTASLPLADRVAELVAI